MKKLHLTFSNAKGRKHKLIPKHSAEDLDAETVKLAMQEIVDAGIFEKEDIGLFQEVVSAKYVETIDTPLF